MNREAETQLIDYRKLKINLFWIIPLFLFIGWTIGFWIGIPQHITFSADEGLERTAYNIMDRAKVILNESIDTMKETALEMNKTAIVNQDCVSYGNVKNLWEDMYYRCSSKEWCNCDYKPRSSTIDRVLTSDKTDNINLAVSWNWSMACPNQEQEVKFEYEGTVYFGYCCETEWKHEEFMTEWEFIEFLRENEGIKIEVFNIGNDISIKPYIR